MSTEKANIRTQNVTGKWVSYRDRTQNCKIESSGGIMDIAFCGRTMPRRRRLLVALIPNYLSCRDCVYRHRKTTDLQKQNVVGQWVCYSGTYEDHLVVETDEWGPDNYTPCDLLACGKWFSKKLRLAVHDHKNDPRCVMCLRRLKRQHPNGT